MAKTKHDNKIKKVWNKSKKCSCQKKDCHVNNHRLCGICNETILYGSHESAKAQINSKGAWNIDHIKSKLAGGSDDIDNLQATHIKCNRNKGNRQLNYKKK